MIDVCVTLGLMFCWRVVMEDREARRQGRPASWWAVGRGLACAVVGMLLWFWLGMAGAMVVLGAWFAIAVALLFVQGLNGSINGDR